MDTENNSTSFFSYDDLESAFTAQMAANDLLQEELSKNRSVITSLSNQLEYVETSLLSKNADFVELSDKYALTVKSYNDLKEHSDRAVLSSQDKHEDLMEIKSALKGKLEITIFIVLCYLICKILWTLSWSG